MLEICNGCKEYFEEVLAWAIKHNLSRKLNEQLCYLDLYGCTWTARNQVTVKLYKDFAPHSFGVNFLNANGELFMNGGLIYHGPDAPRPIDFELDNQIGWSVHT